MRVRKECSAFLFCFGSPGETISLLNSSPILRGLVDIAGEGGENALIAWLTPHLKRAVYDRDAQTAAAGDIAETVLEAMATSLILQGMELPGQLKSRRTAKDLAARWSEADDRAFMAGFDEDIGGHFGSEKNIYPWQWKVETPGETGELAVPYSQRGIPIEERLIGYQEELMMESDYISRGTGEIQRQDLAVLTTETGVEYTMLEIGGKTYLVRGAVKGTTIPKKLIDLLVENQGTLECHSHPYIGDLSPSKTDMMLMRMLPWQKSSVIIDPTQRMMRFDSHGAIGEELDSGRNRDYYDFMDW